MRVTCKKCGYMLDSFILDKGTALQDISKKLNRHLEKDHKEMVEQMQQALGTVAQALLFVGPFTEFVFIPDQEKYVQGKYDEGRKAIMCMLGFSLEESEVILNGDEEEDEDEDEKEDDDSFNEGIEPDSGVIEMKNSKPASQLDS